MTRVVLEAGRTNRRVPEPAPAPVEEKAWRFRLAYMPALPMVMGLLIVVGAVGGLGG
ncbi:hypothetical protein [Azospirillum soli]|uniref:hypothetical protein n=1 Tax=Azospirillum soli TaxID=1304799 RepID=UPI001AE44316|nr:hypothetical protein [Azospirillum soli]MBP2311416.1 hypothetical protein [Azospirillum soli]